jgi:hypothetical protein
MCRPPLPFVSPRRCHSLGTVRHATRASQGQELGKHLPALG